MNTQNNKEPHKWIITIFLVMFFFLAGGSLLAATRFGDEVVAPALMFFFALCFSAIAAWSRKNQWAIIPAGIFATIGLVVTQGILISQSEVPGHFYRFQVLIPKMEILIPKSEVTGLSFMLLSAATFLVFAIMSKMNWWAIIPAGIFASIGLVIVLEILAPQQEFPILPNKIHWGVYSWVMFLGFAVTFGITWLLRKTQPTAWAKYPAAGLLVIAVMALILGSRFQEVWTVIVMIAIGVMLILALFSRKHLPVSVQPPQIKKGI